MSKNNIYILFSLLGTVIVLWQLLGVGYVLTLDMIFGPLVNLTIDNSELLNNLPIHYVLAGLTFVFNGWVAQKILLITIFFLLFYFPLHYFKKIFNTVDTHGAEYVTALFFAINPFVYERFLAGQWTVLFGYALLFPVTTYLAEFCREGKRKVMLKLMISIVSLGAISIHLFMMVVVSLPLILLVSWYYYNENIHFLKQSSLLGLGIVLGSSYWLIPAILVETTPLASFGLAHWDAFRTAGNGNWGVLINVLTLHGFWGEHEPWISTFLLPKKGGALFVISLVLFITVVFTGIWAGIKNKKTGMMTAYLLLMLGLATVFSCGIGDGIFRNVNMWLFEDISFWKGFRDSQKWSAVIALVYSLFAGLGAMAILAWFKRGEYKKLALYFMLAIPILYTPMMTFGFVGQFKPVEYPSGWREVNTILQQDENCRALFLPWHQYYSLKFNNDVLTANLSSLYFDCDIVHGHNTELGNIKDQGENGEEYTAIEAVVTNNDADADATIKFLQAKGIRYIIFTDDEEWEDPFFYPFLNSESLKNLWDKDGIYLFQII